MNDGLRNTLATLGVGCLIAAILGGDVKLPGAEVPAINDLRAQILLGCLGAVVLALVLWRPRRSPSHTWQVTAPTASISVPTGSSSRPRYSTTTYGGQTTEIVAASYRRSADGKTYIFEDGSGVPVREIPARQVAAVTRKPSRSSARRHAQER